MTDPAPIPPDAKNWTGVIAAVPRAGTRFTVASIGVYFLHDIEHHLHDVGA